MRKLVQDLLSTLRTADRETSDEAALRLGLIIEKHSPRRDQEAFYEQVLPPELIRMSLNDEEQGQVVAELGRIVMSDKVTPRLVWALGKSPSPEALRYLVALVCSGYRPGGEDCLWEALMAVEASLSGSADEAMTREALSLVKEHSLGQALDRVTADSDQGLAALAGRIIERLSSLAK